MNRVPSFSSVNAAVGGSNTSSSRPLETNTSAPGTPTAPRVTRPSTSAHRFRNDRSRLVHGYGPRRDGLAEHRSSRRSWFRVHRHQHHQEDGRSEDEFDPHQLHRVNAPADKSQPLAKQQRHRDQDRNRQVTQQDRAIPVEWLGPDAPVADQELSDRDRQDRQPIPKWQNGIGPGGRQRPGPLRTAHAKIAHPSRKQSPPSGVIAPKARTPLSASA